MLTSALTTGFKDFTQDMFLKLFVTQLQNQDPMDPMSNYEFTSQLAQMGQLEQMTAMNTSFQALMRVQEFSNASTMIGKRVSYVLAGSPLPRSGEVSGVRLVDGEVRLAVGADLVSLSSITEVSLGATE